MRVQRRGSDPHPSDLEIIEFGVIMGGVTGHDHPFTLLQDEQEELAAEHKAKLARKRPCGFQAVWAPPE